MKHRGFDTGSSAAGPVGQGCFRDSVNLCPPAAEPVGPAPTSERPVSELDWVVVKHESLEDPRGLGAAFHRGRQQGTAAVEAQTNEQLAARVQRLTQTELTLKAELTLKDKEIAALQASLESIVQEQQRRLDSAIARELSECRKLAAEVAWEQHQVDLARLEQEYEAKLQQAHSREPDACTAQTTNPGVAVEDDAWEMIQPRACITVCEH